VRDLNLLDHLSARYSKDRGIVEADLFRSLQIDHQLELRWLLYWQIGGLGSLRILSM
jgi:hypothetical protein